MGARTDNTIDRAPRFTTIPSSYLYGGTGGGGGSGGGGGATRLDGLADTSVVEGVGIDGYVLRWNNAAVKWVASRLKLGDLSDVTVAPSLAQNGYSLTLNWNGGSPYYQLTNVTGGGGGTGLGWAGALTVASSSSGAFLGAYDSTGAAQFLDTGGTLSPGGFANTSIYNPVFKSPPGTQYVKITAQAGTLGNATGSFLLRALKYQAALANTTLAPASSSSVGDLSAQCVASSSAATGIIRVDMCSCYMVSAPGDRWALDILQNTTGGSVNLHGFGIEALGTGVYFPSGGGAGGAIPPLVTLPDVNVTTGAGVDQYSLVWNNATSKFILKNITAGGAGVNNLYQLSDVNVVENSFIDGYFLVWNQASVKWIAQNMLTLDHGGTSTNLSGTGGAGQALFQLGVGSSLTVRQPQLSDFSQSGATTGQSPIWSGTAWVPGTPSAGSSFQGCLINAASNSSAGQPTLLLAYPINTGATTWNGGTYHFLIPTGVNYIFVDVSGQWSAVVGSNTMSPITMTMYSVAAGTSIYSWADNIARVGTGSGSVQQPLNFGGLFAVTPGDQLYFGTTGGTWQGNISCLKVG